MKCSYLTQRMGCLYFIKEVCYVFFDQLLIASYCLLLQHTQHVLNIKDITLQ